MSDVGLVYASVLFVGLFFRLTVGSVSVTVARGSR